MDKFVWGEGYHAPNAHEPVEHACYVEKVITPREKPWHARIKRAAYGPTCQKVFKVINEASEEVTAAEIMGALDLASATVYMALNAMVVSGKIVRRIGEDRKTRFYSVAP